MIRNSEFNQSMDEANSFLEELDSENNEKTLSSLNKLYIMYVKCSMIAMRKQDKIKAHIEIAKVCKEIVAISEIEELRLHYVETALLEVLEGKGYQACSLQRKTTMMSSENSLLRSVWSCSGRSRSSRISVGFGVSKGRRVVFMTRLRQIFFEGGEEGISDSEDDMS